MNIATGIVIAFVVLYLIFKILAATVESLAYFLVEVTDGFKKAVFYLFGKKFLKRKVNIPNDLLPDSKPLPDIDTQYLNLKNYHPASAHIPQREVMLFKSDTECLTDTHTEATKLFYIEDLSANPLFLQFQNVMSNFLTFYIRSHTIPRRNLKSLKTFFHLPIGRNGKFNTIDLHLEDHGGLSYSAF